MTLMEIKNQLLTFFLKNDTFVLAEESDLKKIKTNSHQETVKKDIISSVLDELAKDGLVVKVINDQQRTVCYSLIAPFASFSQNIEISAQTAELITEILNQYFQSKNQTDYIVDKLNINEFDIQQLAILTAQLLNNLDSDEDGKL